MDGLEIGPYTVLAQRGHGAGPQLRGRLVEAPSISGDATETAQRLPGEHAPRR